MTGGAGGAREDQELLLDHGGEARSEAQHSQLQEEGGDSWQSAGGPGLLLCRAVSGQLLHSPPHIHHLRAERPADVGRDEMLLPGAQPPHQAGHCGQVYRQLLQKHTDNRQAIYILSILIHTYTLYSKVIVIKCEYIFIFSINITQ